MAVDGHALATQTYLAAGLSAWSDLEAYASSEGGCCHFTSKYGSGDGEGEGSGEVIADSGESGILFDAEGDIKVSLRAALRSLAAMSTQTEALPVGHTSRDGDTQLMAIDGEYLLVTLIGIS